MAKQEVPKSIRASLYIDGKPAQNSIKNVEQVARTLRKELNGLTIGTAEWSAKMNQLKVHQATLRNIQNEVRGVGGAFGWLKTEVGKFGTLAAGYLGFQFVTSQFQNIIASNAKLSDSLADIRRVAGLTEDEVRRLDKSFSELDTRTSKTGLREIAVVAGKLGIAKNDILGFVEATDMLVVALGDELGNADQVTTQLGKILNVFDGQVNGDNITRLGNAMVKLANDGVATAGFVSDFTQRVSGMAKTAGMSLGATLGLAAGLEEMGARTESSATAIQKLLVTMGQDLPAAAKVAGVPVKEFTALFAKAPEEALLRYAEGLTQNKAAFSEIAVAFKDAGEEGVRVVETITKLGERADFMRTKFEDGTVALEGYNEIQDAFALKNDTLGAKVEKLGKSFYKMITNKTVTNFFISLVDGAIKAVDWIERNSKSIANFTKVLITAVVAWNAYNLAVKISTATLMTSRTATISAALAKAILTGNTVKMIQAMRLLNLAIKANPIGLLVAVVVAAATAFILFNKQVSDATKIQNNLTNAQLEAEKATIAERQAIDRAQKTLTDDRINRDKKLESVKALRDIMPNVLRDYSDEEILAGKATAAIRKQTESILEQAKARAYSDKITSLESERIDLLDKQQKGWAGSTMGERLKAGFATGVASTEQAYLENLAKEIASREAQIKSLEETMSGKRATPASPFALGGDVDPFGRRVSTPFNEILYQEPGETPTGRPAGGGGDKDKEAKEKAAKIKKEQEDLRAALKKNMDDIYIDSLLGAEKELAQLDQKYDAMREKAHGNKDILKQIDDQYNAEFINLLKKTTDVAEEEAAKRSVAEAEAFEKIEIAGMPQRERELQQMRDYYAELIKMANDYGFDVSAIMAKWNEEEAKLKAGWAKDDAEKADQTALEERDKKYSWAVDSAKLVSDTVFTIGDNNRRAELDASLANIERQRESELSNKNLTEEQKLAINKKFDAKVKAEKTKAFKADQRAAISQAIINGLIGAGQLWIKPGFPAAIPLAAMLAAQTAANVAVIASQKAPAYAFGGFSNEDPAGYVSKATLFNNSASGRPFVAGEAGREWIAPSWMLSSPKYANVIGMLEAARQEKRYFAGGGSTEVTGNTGSTTNSNEKMEALMAETITELRKIKELRVVLEYKTFEEFKAEIEYSRYMQGRK